MDQVEVIAAASGAFGFGVGYLLAYWLAKRDMLREVTMRVNALRKIGTDVAHLRDGQVPWSAIDANLRKFPGQKEYKR